MQLKELIKFIRYDACTGELLTCAKPNALDASWRVIRPNEENKITTTVVGCNLKIKADRLIWYMHSGTQPNRRQVVFHKNLDVLDNRLHNLVLISKNEYFRLVEAMKNISGDMKIIPHSVDAFSYVIYYKLKGRLHKEVVQDIAVARRKFTKLQLKFVKLISKYTVSD